MVGALKPALGFGPRRAGRPDDLADLGLDVLHQRADLARRARRALGELAHFVGDDREAAAVFAGACGFDRRVEREQVRLIGDGVDRLDDRADAVRRDAELPHLRDGHADVVGDLARRRDEPFHGDAAVFRLAVHFQESCEASPALVATWLTETAGSPIAELTPSTSWARPLTLVASTLTEATISSTAAPAAPTSWVTARRCVRGPDSVIASVKKR